MVRGFQSSDECVCVVCICLCLCVSLPWVVNQAAWVLVQKAPSHLTFSYLFWSLLLVHQMGSPTLVFSDLYWLNE